MVQINFSLKEVNCKVVYYGPGLSGKTTNLEVVHGKAPQGSVGDLTSIATEGDRTLFFDFLPLNLGQVAGMKTKFQIYTVPGQVYYNSTRKLVLQGADGVVFVADSKQGKMDENLESLENLLENLREYGMDPNTTPIVLQYNKRDLPEVYTVEELNASLNKWNCPTFEAVARDGVGVFPTLKHLAGMVLESLNRQHSSRSVPLHRPEPVAVGAQVASSPSPTGPAKPMPSAGGQPQIGIRPPQMARTPSPPNQGLRGQAQPLPVGLRVPQRHSIAVARPRKKSKRKLWIMLGVTTLVAAGAYLHHAGLLLPSLLGN